MTCTMKREAWTWYLPNHLVPAKILCSRCEPVVRLKGEGGDVRVQNGRLKSIGHV